jgi:hypothetical protein
MDMLIGEKISLEDLFQKKLEGGIITVLVPEPHWGYISNVSPAQKNFQVNIPSRGCYKKSFTIEFCFQTNFGDGKVFLITAGGKLISQITPGGT